MYKYLLIILLFVPLASNPKNVTENSTTIVQTGKWIQLQNWSQTNPNCNYNCVSIWYTVWKNSIPDQYGYYQYCYLFMSNSKWQNGRSANTGMYGTSIILDGKSITYLNYGIAGTQTQTQTQLSIYFKIHYTYLKPTSLISFSTKQTYLQ